MHALRFVDSQMTYTPPQQRSLLRLLRADPCEDRSSCTTLTPPLPLPLTLPLTLPPTLPLALALGHTLTRVRWFADVCACRRRPQGQLRKSQGLQAVLGTADEFHMLAHEATLWRLRRELGGRRLGVHDLYHAFNGRRNGLLSCAELGAGLAWLQLQSQRPPRAGGSADAMHEADVHALVRGLDTDGDGEP